MKFFSEIKNRVNEAPHYPEDPDEWNAMFGARKKKPQGDPEDYEPRTSPAQQAADDEEALSQKLQAQHKAFAQKRKVEYVDQEGAAPNGQRYNKLYVINAKDMQTANHEEYLFDKHEWGAKKVVDVKKQQNEDGSVTATLYIVDNHKYGTWKPWKNMPAKEGVSADTLEESEEDNPVLGAIIHRIMVGRTDLLSKFGPERIMAAAEDVADFVGDVEEIGSSDVSGWVKQVENSLKDAQLPDDEQEKVTEAPFGPEKDFRAAALKKYPDAKFRRTQDSSRDLTAYKPTPKPAGHVNAVHGKHWGKEVGSRNGYIGLWDVKEEQEADMKSSNTGYNNMLAVMKAVDAGEDATFNLGGEPITLEYPEARFLSGKYKAFLKAGRQEEFLQYMSSPVAFDRLMLQLRHMIDKQKNFKGSVPGERGVEEDARTFAPLSKDQYLAQKKALQDIQLDPETANDPELRKELMHRTGALRKQAVASGLIGVEEDAPALAKMAGGLGLGLVAAAGAPAIVGILGPLLGIPFAAYGAYSAAKMGMAGVEKLWDMATDKLGGSDKVEQYATAQIAKLPPEKAKAANAVIKQVAESRKTVESTGPAKMISRGGKDMDESAPPNFPMDLEKKLLAQYKNDPGRAYATMWTLHNKQKPKTESLKALPAVNENEYWCGNGRMAKPIPTGYKKLSNGYLTRK